MKESISLLVFTVDSLRLGLHLEAVDRVVSACEPTPLPGAPEPIVGAINLAGDVVPVLDLRQRLQLPRRPIGVDDQLLLVRADERRYALTVDDTDGVHEFQADDVVPPAEVAEGRASIQGVVRLADGLLLIEDPRRFLDIEGMRMLAHALRQESAHDG